MMTTTTTTSTGTPGNIAEDSSYIAKKILYGPYKSNTRRKDRLRRFSISTRTGANNISTTTTTTTTSSDSKSSGYDESETESTDDSLVASVNHVIDLLVSAVEYRVIQSEALQSDSAHNTLSPQLRYIHTLDVVNRTTQRVDKLIEETYKKGEAHAVNLHCFVIIHNQYRTHTDPVPYERIVNDKIAYSITHDTLFIDMLNYQTQYRDLMSLCRHLQNRRPVIKYIIYKREIEIINKKIYDPRNTPILDKLIYPINSGYYYAIIVDLTRCKIG